MQGNRKDLHGINFSSVGVYFWLIFKFLPRDRNLFSNAAIHPRGSWWLLSFNDWHNIAFLFVVCLATQVYVPAYLLGVFLIEEIGCFAGDSSLAVQRRAPSAPLDGAYMPAWNYAVPGLGRWSCTAPIFESRLSFICLLVVVMAPDLRW